jgi:hypothetical protein
VIARETTVNFTRPEATKGVTGSGVPQTILRALKMAKITDFLKMIFVDSAGQHVWTVAEPEKL